MERRDWTLLALAAAEGRSLSPAQLQKVLFILGAEKADQVGRNFYHFHPYNYGPFSTEVYQDADALREVGLVRIDSGGPTRRYSATPDGLVAAADRRAVVPDDVLDYLTALVGWARRLNFQQLVSAVYERYPEQRINSIFVEPGAK